ncbi:MAG: hypothetical protein Q4G28_10860 [Neisseria sp.]|nr:hypothetical protein [Neisseria sp.]
MNNIEKISLLKKQAILMMQRVGWVSRLKRRNPTCSGLAQYCRKTEVLLDYSL